MAPRSHPLVTAIRAGLSAAADPARAKGAQAYMKSAMPFRGVPGPVQKRLWREVFAAHPLETSAKWQRVVLELWRTAAFREERYAAVGLAQDRRYLSYRTPAIIPMLEEMIVSGAWWDYVDALASHPLGDVLVADPLKVSRVMRRWANDRDMWKRRSAILCQIRRKHETDLTLLYDCIEPNLADREFFIRKAIGWALRSYAWTDPREIRRYVKTNRARLSPLSTREAMKNISRAT
jgi:3-methyladenine DNA glycosylase AlkD